MNDELPERETRSELEAIRAVGDGVFCFIVDHCKQIEDEEEKDTTAEREREKRCARRTQVTRFDAAGFIAVFLSFLPFHDRELNFSSATDK